MIPDAARCVLERLYDAAGAFVQADELSAGLGRTPASPVEPRMVEAALEAISRRGHRIERNPARGVRLIRPTAMDAHLIERDLPVQRAGRHVICFGEVDSTNDVAFASAGGSGGQALVVTAESQRAGRGRLGRTWISPPGSGLLASVLLDAESARLPAEALTIAAGLAVAEGADRAGGVETTLRWPNDVMIGSGKLAGVLVEVRGGSVVIGFGINVSAAPELYQKGDRYLFSRHSLLKSAVAKKVSVPLLAARPAVCLDDVAGRPIERIELARAVLTSLDGWLAELLAGRTEPLHQRWRARCEMINQRVRIVSAGRQYAGRVLDVSPTHGLALQTDDGRAVHLPAALSTVL